MNGAVLGLGSAAGLAIACLVLFVEEAGAPLPAPGEVALLAAGLAVAEGALSWWLVVSASILATCLGAVAGYSWTRRVGTARVLAVARRIGAGRACERLLARVAAARPGGIAAARLTPGLRVYTTLACGAAQADRRVFLAGAIPAAVVWVLTWTAAGILVGVPAVRVVGDAERLTDRVAPLALVVLAVVVLICATRRLRSHRASTGEGDRG